jgi:steroid delta-isomerase-like uncharacterized protein
MTNQRFRAVSRRAALRVGGGVAAFASIGTAATYAQDATPSDAAVPRIVHDWVDAWNSDDPVTNLAALYTADAVYDDVPTGLSNVTIGIDVESFVRAFVEQISDIEFVLRSGFGSGSWAAAEWDFTFNYTGQLPGLPQGTGQHIRWLGATIFELVGKKIQRNADYYDNTGLLAAVGLLPIPAATPST